MFVVLKPWKERKGADNSVEAVIAKADEIGASEQEAIVFSINPPAIPGLGMSSGLQMELLDINNLGAKEISQAISEIQNAARQYPELQKVTTLYQGEVPQYSVKVDRDKVKMYNLALQDVYSVLSSFMGSNYVNDFTKFGRTYEVLISGEEEARRHATDVLGLSVRNSLGDMVPFGSFASVEPVLGQSVVNRYNMYTSASVTASVAPHVSSSEGIRAMEEIMADKVG